MVKLSLEKKLSEIEPGTEVFVKRVIGDKNLRKRIADMGIVKGTRIKVVRKAPLGDPVEFELKGYSLSLRKNEAENVYVEEVG